MEPQRTKVDTPESDNSGDIKKISEERKKELIAKYGAWMKKVGVVLK
jgi:hypothetical protein